MMGANEKPLLHTCKKIEGKVVSNLPAIMLGDSTIM